MEAKAHTRQAARLKSLYSYEILDTDPEQDFDDIVKLAAAICQAPVAIVSFVDQDRQWFKARTGTDVQQTPIELSICAHAILESDFVEITDTLADERTKDNRLCCDAPDLRFYAGAVLTDAEGLPLGTLCVLDTVPRGLTPLQRDAIKVLARQVMVQLEMRKSLRLATLLRQEVDHRVKNSLQSVASYIRIQSREVAHPDAKAAFNSIQNRIEAISVLHEQLYLSGSGARVELGRYLGKLRNYLSKLAPVGVEVIADTVPVEVGARQAANLGTLMNEFALNAFKYAFPDGQTGVVRLEIKIQDNGEVSVNCSDNGTGMKALPDEKSGGLGTKVAKALCDQIDATLSAQTGPAGTIISVRFFPDDHREGI